MGIIYLIRAESTNRYKIGFTSQNIAHRLSNLQTACPFDLEVVSHREGTQKDEKALHNALHKFRLRGEWFEFETDAKALWYFHNGKRRTRDEIQQDKVLRDFVRASKLADRYAAEIKARMLQLTIGRAKQWVQREGTFYELCQYMAYENLETGRQPNLDEFAYACTSGLNNYFQNKQAGRPPLWDKPEVPDHERKPLLCLEPLPL